MDIIPLAVPAMTCHNVCRLSTSLDVPIKPTSSVIIEKYNIGLMPGEYIFPALMMNVSASKPPIPVQCPLNFHHKFTIPATNDAIVAPIANENIHPGAFML